MLERERVRDGQMQCAGNHKTRGVFFFLTLVHWNSYKKGKNCDETLKQRRTTENVEQMLFEHRWNLAVPGPCNLAFGCPAWVWVRQQAVWTAVISSASSLCSVTMWLFCGRHQVRPWRNLHSGLYLGPVSWVVFWRRCRLRGNIFDEINIAEAPVTRFEKEGTC